MNRADSHPRERISAWLDGELGQEERTVVLEHLAGCASCRALVDDLTILAKATREEPIPPVPEGLEERIAWRLRSAAAAQRRPRWRTLVPLTAVASLMVVGILVVVLREQRLAPPLPSFAPPQPSREAAAPEPPASQEKALDSLAEKKEANEQPPKALGYLGGSKDAETAPMAKQAAPAAPPAAPPVETPSAGARDRDARLDEPARQAEPVPLQEMAKARAATPAESEVGDARRAEGTAGVVPSNEAAPSELRGFAPAPKVAAKSLAATCVRPWDAPDSIEVRVSRDRLTEIANRLGGTVTPDASETGLVRVQIPTARSGAFLRELGDARTWVATLPSDADCVRVAVRLLP